MPGTDTVGIVFGFPRGDSLEVAASIIPMAKPRLSLTGTAPLRRTPTGLVFPVAVVHLLDGYYLRIATRPDRIGIESTP